MEKVPDPPHLSQTAMRFPFSFRTPGRGSAVWRRRRRRPVRRRFPGGKRVLEIAVAVRTRGRGERAGRTLARAGKRSRRREGTRSLYRRPPRVQLEPAGSSAAKTRNRVRGRGGRRTDPSRAGTPGFRRAVPQHVARHVGVAARLPGSFPPKLSRPRLPRREDSPRSRVSSLIPPISKSFPFPKKKVSADSPFIPGVVRVGMKIHAGAVPAA